MTTPLFNLGAFIVAFEAMPEHLSARQHFIRDCGWSESEFRKIKNFAWFTARVSVWLNGEELASDYLGCCSYGTESEFYITHKGDYFADMVFNCAQDSQNAELLTLVNAWRETLRTDYAGVL